MTWQTASTEPQIQEDPVRISSIRPRFRGSRRSRPGSDRNRAGKRSHRGAAAGIAALAVGVGLAYAGFGGTAAVTHPANRLDAASTTAATTTAATTTAASTTAARPTTRAAGPAAGQGTASVRRACPVPARAGIMQCLTLIRTDVKPLLALAPNATPSGYGPSDLQSAYNLPSGSAGSGQTVAVVDAYDDPNAASDLATYRSQYGLPACTTANGCFSKVNENGQASPLPPAAGTTGWATEESLDLDMVSAICPNCHIVLVEASSPAIGDLGTGVDAAVQLGAEYVSNSYGGTEDPTETSADAAYYNHPGVAVTASAGDSGYAAGVSYPAASRGVVAVGGTKLTQDSSTSRGWTETVWNELSAGYGATGSGCSADEPKPSWQQDTGCGNRTDNDVSAEADPLTGVAVYDTYDQGGWGVAGGTSASSPMIASAYALGGRPAAGTYPSSYLYAHPTSLNDVTSGNDGSCSPAYLCTAGPGYDGPTGLGTPDGIAAFSTSAQPVTGMISSGITGKCVDDHSDSTANGNKIDIYSCNGTAAQDWTVGTDGTIQVNGKCLDVYQNGYANGSKIDLYTCVSGAMNQQWRVQANGGLVSLASGKCLDDPGYSTTNGTQLDIWSCVNQANEDWYVPPPGASAGPAYSAVASATTGKCLDDNGDSAANGNKIDIWDCNGSAAQNWTAQPDGTIQVNDKCLDVYQNSYANGAKIDLYTCVSGAMNQQWRLQANGNLVSLASGKCLDDPGYSTTNGTQVDIYSCVNQANESWTLP
jgi:Ricin-type beta-trefoil lectin domain